uniref:Uncharacterized protein n=1 Tax=uncultured marine group II/III euryarchaeote KM3_61_H04 TaxID=1456471 RepID=A0A075H9W6_9EURY|nr:hypothetical protein [uncultured marine group II/III euryarchaeote KM3_61_H04]
MKGDIELCSVGAATILEQHQQVHHIAFGRIRGCGDDCRTPNELQLCGWFTENMEVEEKVIVLFIGLGDIIIPVDIDREGAVAFSAIKPIELDRDGLATAQHPLGFIVDHVASIVNFTG